MNGTPENTAPNPSRDENKNATRGRFKLGHDPRRDGTSRLGATNSYTRDIRQALLEAAERHGQDGRGAAGLPGYCFYLARRHPKAFATLMGKAMPMQVVAPMGAFIANVNIVAVPADRFLSAADIAKLTPQFIDAVAEVAETIKPAPSPPQPKAQTAPPDAPPPTVTAVDQASVAKMQAPTTSGGRRRHYVKG